MTFSVHIDQETADTLARLAKKTGRKRNALIREAIRSWVERERRSEWPEAVLQFRGVPSITTFESYRHELKPPRERPLR